MIESEVAGGRDFGNSTSYDKNIYREQKRVRAGSVSGRLR
jgi:hypothetical protein